MLFNSFVFGVFLPIVYAAYWSMHRAPLRYQNLLLVAASYLFYGWWDYRFLALIIISSIVDYAVGMALAQTSTTRTRRALLGLSIVTNLGILGFFKYYNFFIDSFSGLLHSVGLQANPHTLMIVLPVGISFYTFQTLSYTIDVYRRDIDSTEDVVAFFAYVSFFPQLVAGPIERARYLLPQFEKPRTFETAIAKDGLRQMLWGFFKKVIIADNLAAHVDGVFRGSDTGDGLTLVIGVFLFAIQIYCDFSGYSDIAIGTARLFGFDLMQNFSFPYFSRDIAEFWKRWHISLSTWFRDYVYIPLGGSRTSQTRHIRNVIITFTLSGLWHGASWNFVVWGFLNGLYYVPFILSKRHRQNVDTVASGRVFPRLAEVRAMALTFVATLVAWVFFRADSIEHAAHFLAGVVTRAWNPLAFSEYAVPLLSSSVVLIVEWFQREKKHGLEISSLPGPLRWAIYYSVLILLLRYGSIEYVPFIYFQF
jgi:alginate O-acetyltransferase complex protein AlgI